LAHFFYDPSELDVTDTGIAFDAALRPL